MDRGLGDGRMGHTPTVATFVMRFEVAIEKGQRSCRRRELVKTMHFQSSSPLSRTGTCRFISIHLPIYTLKLHILQAPWPVLTPGFSCDGPYSEYVKTSAVPCSCILKPLSDMYALVGDYTQDDS